MAYFHLQRLEEQLLGDLHAQGRDGRGLLHRKKVVVERWAKEHFRSFNLVLAVSGSPLPRQRLTHLSS